MSEWEDRLQRWRAAGLIDDESAARIRDWESAQQHGWRLPVLIALALGAILLGAGILLFVSAHWDDLSPGVRFSLVALLTGGFHVAAAFLAERFPPLASALHALGTVALGAGILLAGQIFHLEAQWNGGALLWAVGAWAGFLLLRDEAQFVLAALLTPAWLSAEWTKHAAREPGLPEGLFLLALAYLTSSRRSLAWAGGVALLPTALFLVLTNSQFGPPNWYWPLGVLLPLGPAYLLRGRAVWLNIAAAAWVAMLQPLSGTGLYAWSALTAVGLLAWGVGERRGELVNLGVAGFALTVLVFYFSNVMDKLGRSLSLVTLGVLFLAGGWGLEQLRRRLIARVREVQP